MDERPTIETASGPVTLIRDAAIADIEAYEIDCGLSSIMRSATVRRRVLRELAADPHARLTLAVAAGAVVGHLGIGPSFGRWRVLPRVREIAFEVARGWRQSGLVSAMIRRAMADPAIEDEIIVGFLWPAAWDLAELAGSRIAYRDMLMRIAARVGFQAYGTDEPELLYQQGASLVARIGAHVPANIVETFDRARYARDAALARAS